MDLNNPRIDTTATLGQALRRTRRHLGLTQPQLALASGVGVRFIVDLEAGKPTIQLGRTLQVIDALGTELILTGGAVVDDKQQDEQQDKQQDRQQNHRQD